MSVHLIKMAVGVESVAHLAELQSARLRKAAREGQASRLCHYTRHMPRRAQELLAGGSLYWVIKGFVRVRQRLLDIERGVGPPWKQGGRQGGRPGGDPEGKPACALVLDPGLVGTRLRATRAFQGWRYLAAPDAPPDLDPAADAVGLPQEMAEELRSLGLL